MSEKHTIEELEKLSRACSKFIAVMVCIAFVTGWAAIALYLATKAGGV